jgi:hypothetical protein
MLFIRRLKNFFITIVCAGVASKKNPKPARALENEKSKTDSELNYSWPALMEEATAEIDPRNIGGNVIDKLSVCKSRPCACRQTKRPGVYRSNKSSTKKDTSWHRTIGKVVSAERADNLKAE